MAVARLALIVGVFSVAGSIDVWPKLPGDPKYFVQLKSLQVSEGQLEPAFDPAGRDFTVRVQNTHATKMVLTLELDQEKYELMHCPDVFVDGLEKAYSPLQPIVVEVPLNETSGPLDRTVRITLADPSGGGSVLSSEQIHDLSGGWFGKQVHEYAIRLRQEPDYDEVLRAKEISVLDASGSAIASSPAFLAGSAATHYLFKLASDQTAVRLRLRCPDVATQTLVDGRKVNGGGVQNINLSHALSKIVVVACAYHDEAWSQHTQERNYFLKFERAGDASLGPVRLNLIMEPQEGYCQEDPEAGSHGGFTCRTAVAGPRIVATSNASEVEKRLLPASGGEGDVLDEGVPHSVEVAQHEARFILLLKYGSTKLRYPIQILKPAKCETMECPVGMALRPNLDSKIAKDRLCLTEPCTEEDAPRCCQAVATCDTFDPAACPHGTLLKRSASDWKCQGTTCSAADHDACCAPRSKCSGFTCPEGHILRLNASLVECTGDVCLPSDAHACCEPRAVCSTLAECPAGEALRQDAEDASCSGNACSVVDQPTCCRPRANCSALASWPACTGGTTLRHDAANVSCIGEFCTHLDLDTCCQPYGTCDSAKCGPTYVLRADAADAVCAGDVCTEEDECCRPRATCASTQLSCPHGHTLRSDADEVLCAGEACAESDEGACCQQLAACSEFQHGCPEGMLLRHDAASTFCAGGTCTADDSWGCCVSEEEYYECLLWAGDGGCSALKDEESCLSSKDGRPWQEWDSKKVAGQPCAWCSGEGCGSSRCEPSGWIQPSAHTNVTTASCAHTLDLLAEKVVEASPEASEHNMIVLGDRVVSFENLSDGNSWHHCRSERSGEEPRNFFWTFSASSLSDCQTLCASKGYCIGIEFDARHGRCELWWRPISTVIDRGDGRICQAVVGLGQTVHAALRSMTQLEQEDAPGVQEAAAAAKAAEQAAAEEAAKKAAAEAAEKAAAEAAQAAEQTTSILLQEAEDRQAQDEPENATTGGQLEDTGPSAAVVGGAVGGSVAAVAAILGGVLGGVLGTTSTTTTTTALTTVTTTTPAELRFLLGSDTVASRFPSTGWLLSAFLVAFLLFGLLAAAVCLSTASSRRRTRSSRGLALLGWDDSDSSSESDSDSSSMEQGRSGQQALQRALSHRLLHAVVPQFVVDQVFNRLDRDGDGLLTRQDFEEAAWPLEVSVPGTPPMRVAPRGLSEHAFPTSPAHAMLMEPVAARALP